MIKIIVILLFAVLNLNSSENQIKPNKQIIKAAWKLSSRLSPNPIKFEYVFDSSFIEKFGEEKLVKIFKDLYSETGSVLSISTVSFENQNSANLFLHTEKNYIIPITITINAKGKINSFSFRPPFKKTLSASDIVDKFKSLKYEKKGILIKKLTQIEDTLYAYNDEECFAIGQAFSLYILSYLAENEKKWEKIIKVNNNYKSIPPGTLLNYPNSSPATVFTLAYHMITESDNTAMDILIDYIGKEKIENYIKEKNKNYLLNIPLLKTKEAFLLKTKPHVIEKYQKLSTKEKLDILNSFKNDEVPTHTLNFSTPFPINSVGWFASPKEICYILDHIRIINNPFINSILSTNPGLDLSPGGYLWGGFKGGRDKGIMTLNWLVKAKDERYYCISIMVNDSQKDIDEDELIKLSQELLNIFGTE